MDPPGYNIESLQELSLLPSAKSMSVIGLAQIYTERNAGARREISQVARGPGGHWLQLCDHPRSALRRDENEDMHFGRIR